MSTQILILELISCLADNLNFKAYHVHNAGLYKYVHFRVSVQSVNLGIDARLFLNTAFGWSRFVLSRNTFLIPQVLTPTMISVRSKFTNLSILWIPQEQTCDKGVWYAEEWLKYQMCISCLNIYISLVYLDSSKAEVRSRSRFSLSTDIKQTEAFENMLVFSPCAWLTFQWCSSGESQSLLHRLSLLLHRLEDKCNLLWQHPQVTLYFGNCLCLLRQP